MIRSRTPRPCRAFIEYLATPEAAEIWAKRGGFASPNKSVDAERLRRSRCTRATATAIAEAEMFRFDMSDLQPAAFGGTAGQGMWKLFQDFLKNPSDVDGIAQQAGGGGGEGLQVGRA